MGDNFLFNFNLYCRSVLNHAIHRFTKKSRGTLVGNHCSRLCITNCYLFIERSAAQTVHLCLGGHTSFEQILDISQYFWT